MSPECRPRPTAIRDKFCWQSPYRIRQRRIDAIVSDARERPGAVAAMPDIICELSTNDSLAKLEPVPSRRFTKLAHNIALHAHLRCVPPLVFEFHMSKLHHVPPISPEIFRARLFIEPDEMLRVKLFAFRSDSDVLVTKFRRMPVAFEMALILFGALEIRLRAYQSPSSGADCRTARPNAELRVAKPFGTAICAKRFTSPANGPGIIFGISSTATLNPLLARESQRSPASRRRSLRASRRVMEKGISCLNSGSRS